MKMKFIQLANAFINADNDQERFERKVELNNMIVAVKVILTDSEIEMKKKRGLIETINYYSENMSDERKKMLLTDFEAFQYIIVD